MMSLYVKPLSPQSTMQVNLPVNRLLHIKAPLSVWLAECLVFLCVQKRLSKDVVEALSLATFMISSDKALGSLI